MKYLLTLIFLLLFKISSYGQKSVFFKGIEFDSSYSIIGIGQGYDNSHDSLPGFWFLIDRPEDMVRLKQNWVFKNPVPTIKMEEKTIEIYIIRDKRLINPGGLIFPLQGIIKSEYNWYPFDTAELVRLHKEHPFKYHTETRKFDTFLQYVAYANSIIHDSALLFFFEPSLGYEGKFEIIANRSADPSSPIFVLSDINKELKALAPENSFQAGHVINDSFNIANSRKVKITVECSKALYDKYKSKWTEKGDWQPSIIKIKTFWRD